MIMQKLNPKLKNNLAKLKYFTDFVLKVNFY